MQLLRLWGAGKGMQPPRTVNRRLLVVALLPATALGAAMPAAARADSHPVVRTGGTEALTPTGVTIKGSVNPRNRPTRVFIQYGRKRLSQKTAEVTIAPTKARVPVKIALAKLRPRSTYRYRLAAYSSAGRANGKTRRFRTPRVPPSVTLTAGPAIVRAGRTVILSGSVGGSGAVGSRVVVGQRPFPYVAPFAPFGNRQIVGKTGAFATFAQPQVNTQFQAIANVDGRRTGSPIVTVGVRPSVSLRAKRYKSRRLRFYGSVKPAGDYRVTLRRLSRRGKRVTAERSATTVKPGSTRATFRFNARRTMRARYLVLVQSPTGAHVKTESSAKLVAASRRR